MSRLGLVLSACLASALTGLVGGQSLTIVEYRHAPTNKFFLTASDSEKALLDRSAHVGWSRTGVTFSAWAAGESPEAMPVCRFFVPAVASHFMSVDPAECAQVGSLPGFVDEGIAWYAARPQLPDGRPATSGAERARCAPGLIGLYRAFNNGHTHPANGQANHRYFTDLTLYHDYGARGYALEGLVMCLPLSEREKRADAARLLLQATFGPRPGDTEAVLRQGVSAWLEAQFSAPVTRYTPREWMPANRPDTCINQTSGPLTPSSYCQRDNYTLFQPQREFFAHAINATPDQLRQRLAWAWSQFFVVSSVDVPQIYGIVDYQQMLRDHAFSNFRELLTRVTLHAAMGRMLDMVNNQKATATSQPNENFARELLQLFSIGLYQLGPDGRRVLDASGQPIPAFTEADVKALAAVLTGWTYPTVPGNRPQPLNRIVNVKGEMEERRDYHHFGEERILGQVVSSTLTQSERLHRVLDIIFRHPNVGPFVSRFLIQHFVTGDPSPSYVERVANVFNDNGQGVRGDIKAVIRAILTDPEARGPAKWSPHYGHLAEPVLLITRLARALGANTDGVFFRTLPSAAGQNVFNAPSVFNYYPPGYRLAASGINAPEFAIYHASTAMARANLIYTITSAGPNIAPDPTVYGATGTQLDWASWSALAATPAALLDRLDEFFFAGQMSATTRETIERAMLAIPASDALNRARLALYLAAVAPAAQVLR
ncbi:MAG: DUF1800 family protein [Casimicrobiaceae bacterium]|nr:DUF1800 family protein [Casimicrobiaceae bacterium]MDW8311544.1 DUF1800 family protein [Burkholderiales bacterium]